jgi:hypothetical protein
MSALFVAIGTGVMWSFGAAFARQLPAFAAATFGSTTAPKTTPVKSQGPPLCCAPFVMAFIGWWTWLALRGGLELIGRLRGRERWTFQNSAILPTSAMIAPKFPPLFAVADEMRAGLCRVGRFWRVGFSSGKQELTLGPFDSKELAAECEAELRRRRPNWFSETDGTPKVFGISEWERIDENAPESPIERVELIHDEVGALRVRIHRTRRYRTGTAFLIFWLGGWIVGELFVCNLLFNFL